MKQVLDIYDSTAGMLRIGPFNYDPIRGVDLWLAQSDAFLLQHLSTSPEVEPPHFTSQVCTKIANTLHCANNTRKAEKKKQQKHVSILFAY